ncbi:Transcriptional regulator containing HTH domain [Methanonatronarchaeum thermophilum]|uniref:Transcriptional regulator containing HTH domain n=1 Tax=Methanonatronarchaeum thermophilum TaxID=1927129 RepID=A0A1Y3GEN6_9EURY|nr:winged helix-turn-helix domain-containing protein [Methanonatronarchaeum thermophilum]OUJ18763.1 Transcriptional regulator containing HTH domain [Methanonatronarchaeum thermophilum]
MKKRSDWEIYLAILENLNEMKNKGNKIIKTNVMHEINMNWKSFNKHFIYLEQNQFLKKNNEDYEITKKGQKLHQTLKTLKTQLP